MVKHTRRRGGTWYDPRTWFSSSSSPEVGAPAPTQSDFGVAPAAPAAPGYSPYGGRKKSRRKH